MNNVNDMIIKEKEESETETDSYDGYITCPYCHHKIYEPEDYFVGNVNNDRTETNIICENCNKDITCVRGISKITYICSKTDDEIKKELLFN